MSLFWWLDTAVVEFEDAFQDWLDGTHAPLIGRTARVRFRTQDRVDFERMRSIVRDVVELGGVENEIEGTVYMRFRRLAQDLRSGDWWVELDLVAPNEARRGPL